VSFLALVIVGAFSLFPLIRMLAGDSFIFVLGFICFFSPLVGWGVQVCFGKFLPRLGDWLPVGALLLSFCCGLAIFNDVVLSGYNPTFAKEYRFNWFDIAGDGSKDGKGTVTLSDAEYAAQRGASMVAARGLKGVESEPQIQEMMAHELANKAPELVAQIAACNSNTEFVRLWGFDPSSKDADKAFAALAPELRIDAYAWLVKRRLEKAVAAAPTAPPEGGEELLSTLESTLAYVAVLELGRTLNDIPAPKEGSQEEAALKGVVSSLEAARTASAVFLPSEVAPAPVLESKAGDVTKALVAFADAEQAIHNYQYYYITDKSSPLFTAYLRDYRQAENTHYQAFAIGILIDNVTAVTLLMVTLLAFLIHLFSIGYMHGEIRYGRFMATINLFTAGMIGLVLANNFLWLFICWEIMGLCSYLLIGHYFEKKSAQEASMKAFFTTRIADTFMFVGMMMIFASTGTFLFAGSESASDAMRATGEFMGDVEYAGAGSLFAILGSKELLLGGIGASAIGLLCFIGPAGKSAQFPFHVWLPDAMEGPTPVSAMIHAACMVSAGVYLTARLFPLFTPDTLQIIAIVGGFTALAAGTIGLVQTDLKKVLAYSTISQLGYMFMGIGVGAWYPALFHMLTHAFFKALMFLGSGSVILGCHHEQEMPKMGGLWKKMPITTITFWIGNASIIGLPFFFAGYYSKEAILTDAIIFGKASGQWLPYIFGAVGAGLTTFYMCRLMWLTFHGKPRDKHLYDHVKESPWTVVTPLIVIAIGSLFVSWPIGAHKDDVNLGLTNLVASENVGEAGKTPPQASNESWLATRWRKPASAYSEGFLRTEYPSWSSGDADVGYGVTRDRLDVLYSDNHGRPQYANTPAWKQHDLGGYTKDQLFSHGDDHGDKPHAWVPVAPDTVYATEGAGTLPTISMSGTGGLADSIIPMLRAAGSNDGHAHGGRLDSHDVHAYHDAHHGAHVMAFMVALAMLALGIGLSMYFYLGPLAGRDWIGHYGFLASVKRTLRGAYYVDGLYDATLLRANRWLRQVCSWFDRVFVDGLVNLMGTWTRWMCRVAAKTDHWGVDGSVRGIGNATFWSGRQASRATTGRIQDYVFLLVATVVVLFIIVVMFRK